MPRESFYDDYLLMVHCPELQRVYDILYHRDVKTITPEVLALAGSGGLVSLWCDRGTSSRRRISFHGLRKADLAMKVAIWLERLGYPVAAPGLYAPGRVVRLDEASTAKLARDLYPLVHSSMRKGLLHGER